MDPREARFLASQAERLAVSKKQQNGGSSSRHCVVGDDVPDELANDDNNSNNGNANGNVGTSKEQSHQFFTNFRKVCAEFQGQIDDLLLMPSSSSSSPADSSSSIVASSNSNDNDVSKNDDVKTYYATAARRNEGRIKLDSILQHVRSLQRHALSSSSSVLMASSRNNVKNDDGSDLLQSILQNHMPDVAQTDMRLMSQEIDKILKRTDDAREIICPKEKFVFKRYRKAMEEMERNGGILTEAPDTKQSNDMETEKMDESKNQQDSLRSKYGGVLENMSNCTIEISSDGTVLANETPEDKLQYYIAPRPVHAMHPPSRTNVSQQQQQPPTTDESSSYLLQNLQNVTLLIHGSRPSIHMQHIHNCKIYISEPTLGAVHVTDCHSSVIRCSCYQLRVHDSKDVKFGVWVRSGPIIEDSRGMEFEGNYYLDGGNKNEDGGSEGSIGRNMYWDVKDFNWLRALRKSPNFMVIAESAGGSNVADKADAKSQVTGDVKPSVSHDEEEDSEDEL